MAKIIYLKNTTPSPIELVEIGETIPVDTGGSPQPLLNLTNTSSLRMRRIENLETLINDGSIIVSDGENDLTPVGGFEYMINEVVGDIDGFWYTKRRRFGFKVKDIAHGYLPGEVMYVDDFGNPRQAVASSVSFSSTSFVITEIIDVDSYYAGSFGSIFTPDASNIVEGLPLSPGSSYFLSATVPGSLTLTPPSNAGEVVKLIGLTNSNADTMIVLNYPGYVNQTALNAAEVAHLKSGTSAPVSLPSYLPTIKDIVNDPLTLTPQDGDRYIIGIGENEWLNHNGEIAEYVDATSSWFFTSTKNGNITFDKSKLKFIDFDGTTWNNTLPSPSVFGNNFQMEESLAVSTHTNNTFESKIQLTTPDLPPGTYRIGISYGWNSNSISSDFESRFMEDDTRKGEIHKEEPSDVAGTFGSTGTNQKHYIERVFYSTYDTTESHHFHLEYRNEDNTSKVSMFDAKIEIWQVS